MVENPDIKYYYDIDQGTPEWLEKRRGILTASIFSSLITPTGKIANNATVRKLVRKIVAERVTGRVEDGPNVYFFERGHEFEPIVRECYSSVYGDVKECGIVIRDFGDVVIGMSPDGLIGDDGIMEIKVRNAELHLETIVEDTIPAQYVSQMQVQMFVSGRKWNDYTEYSNGMPLYVKRLKPDLEYHALLLEAARSFEQKVAEMTELYKAKAEGLVETEFVELNYIGDELEMETEGE
jgi:predicted phage-related endonuclease